MANVRVREKESLANNGRQKVAAEKYEKENKALKQVHWMNFIAVTYFFAGFFLLLAFFFAATKLTLRRLVYNNS